MLIKEVNARIIKDSRGEKTIEVSVNNSGWASSPSGKSTGKYESKPYYQDIKWNVDFLNSWKKWLEIEEFEDLIRVEDFLKQKFKLKSAREFGGNALFAFESAILKALAREHKRELWEVVNERAKNFPRPVGNAIGGGMHTQAKIKPVFQEFLLIPREKKFSDNVAVMKGIYREIGKQLKTRKVNDEGAWIGEVNDEEALKILSEFSDEIEIGVDMAASTFYKNRLYEYNKISRTEPAHFSHLQTLIKEYGVFYVEDPFNEEDFEDFGALKKSARESMIVGDDLTATHIERLEEAIKSRSISGMIVKPNQNGSLIEVKRIVEICKQHKITTIMSHRSGETMDDALADYAFAFGTDFIKCGIATAWRECKLKRMMEIENYLR